MTTLYYLSVFLHVLCAVIWIGGIMFLMMVLVPAIRHPELRDKALSLITLTGRKFRNVAWACLLTLVITGITNMALGSNGMWLTSEYWIKSQFGHILMTKILLVSIIIIISLWHDLIVGPQATEAMRSAPDAPKTLKLRKQASLIGRVNAALSLIVLALAVVLSRMI